MLKFLFSLINMGKLYLCLVIYISPVLLPEKSHGQRSQWGYSPLSRKESDTTEQIHFK